jgi:hypothetical protein
MKKCPISAIAAATGLRRVMVNTAEAMAPMANRENSKTDVVTGSPVMTR